MEALSKQVAFVHKVTVIERDNSFLMSAKNINGNKKQKRLHDSGQLWTPSSTTILSLANCPRMVSKLCGKLRTVIDYWKRNVIPGLKRGQSSVYLKAAAICIARCCCNSSGTILVPGKLTMYERKVIPSPDPNVTKILLFAAENTSDESDDDNGQRISHEIGEEALEIITTTILKAWQTIYDNKTNDMTGAIKRFGPVISFIDSWGKISEWYEQHLCHKTRDANLAFIQQGIKPYTKQHRVDGTILYPVTTDPSVIIRDYYFKLMLELVLSPHIHVEWKIDMCLFLNKDSHKMVKAFEKDISRSATDALEKTATCDYGRGPIEDCLDAYEGVPRYNPTRILPCAANFWDMCRSGEPPSSARYVMVFNEPSSVPSLTSGAGAFATFNGVSKYDAVAYEQRKILSAALANLLGVDNGDDISTRRWLEEGSVICMNLCPLTCASAPLGFGERRAREMSKGFWIKAIQRAILVSEQRQRNCADKNNRSSDLLSDGGNVSLETVVFGCNHILSQLTNISQFDVKVNYHDAIFSNSRGANLLYRAQSVVSHSFPALL